MTEQSNPYRYGEVPVPVENKVKAVLIFNRLNGMYLGAASIGIELCDLDHPHCIYIEDVMDLMVDSVEGGLKISEDGTYTKDYKIVTEAERGVVVYESELDSQMAYKITKQYTVVEQINVLSRAISAIGAKVGVELEELDEMVDYINLVRETSKNHKEFYRTHPEYEFITNEQAAEIEASRFEGGLHEAIGPRTITGGSVFG